MLDARHEPASPWTPELVRRWFADRDRSGTIDRGAVGPYHRAAAVLASFDHRTLNAPGVPPLGASELAGLLTDCVPAPGPLGAARWTLKPEARRTALASFPDARTLRAALSWNPRPQGVPLQRALDAYILGTAPRRGPGRRADRLVRPGRQLAEHDPDRGRTGVARPRRGPKSTGIPPRPGPIADDRRRPFPRTIGRAGAIAYLPPR